MLRRAYLASRYEVAGVRFRIGRRSPGIDALLARLGARQGALLGAWNPQSRRMPPGWNRRAEARLRAAAAGLPFAEGWGGTPHWREHHLLIAGDPRRLARLGRRFRQRAMLVLVQGRPPRLVWLRGGGSDGR
jgi:hypothetical protein